MENARSTYALLDQYEHRLKAVAGLLNVTENTLRNYLAESGIKVKRANADNPKSPAIRLFDLPKIFEFADYRRRKNSRGTEGKRPVVVAVEIIKGGTAKTTTTGELAVQLQLFGLKVLAIDLDIQANLTHILGYEADLSVEEAEKFGVSHAAIVTGTFATLCKPLLDRRRAVSVDAETLLKRPFGPFGPALIPSDTFFGDLEIAIATTQGPRELTFQKFFRESQEGRIPGLNVGDYDVVIMDCPPHVSFVATNAIAAADIIIAPVRMEAFSVKGLSKLITEIETLREAYPNNVRQPELVILPAYYSINLTRNARMQDKLSQYPGCVAPTLISQSEEFPKSLESYLPLTLTKPRCEAVKQYQAFADFMYKKIRERAKSQKTEGTLL
ncbi:MAG: ParA family protein [Zoogloeaceae bacterium]|jgi:chromosome partitioning protein|nr:ParA family protein [Zoogloeaceae bacterium]